MPKIQERLESLKPYIIGIRFVESFQIVEVAFRDGWVVPESKIVINQSVGDYKGHYMFYSENDGIGFDELLDYTEAIINANLEREYKQEFLKTKINELKQLFTDKPLSSLKKLRFVIDSEDLSGDEINLDNGINIKMPESLNPINSKVLNSETKNNIENKNEGGVKSKDDGKSNLVENPVHNSKSKSNHGNIELPPKGDKCTCGPNEACDKCIDSKSL